MGAGRGVPGLDLGLGGLPEDACPLYLPQLMRNEQLEVRMDLTGGGLRGLASLVPSGEPLVGPHTFLFQRFANTDSEPYFEVEEVLTVDAGCFQNGGLGPDVLGRSWIGISIDGGPELTPRFEWTILD